MLQDFQVWKKGSEKGGAGGLRIQAVKGPAKLLITALAGLVLYSVFMISAEFMGYRGWASISAKGRSLKFSFFYSPSKELHLFLPGSCVVKINFQGLVKVADLKRKLLWSGTFQEAADRFFLVLEVKALDRLWMKGENVVEISRYVFRVSRRFPSGEPKVVSIVGNQGRYLLRILRVENVLSAPEVLYNSFKSTALEEVCIEFTRQQK